jgi:pantoate--beta-alanine ligase
VTMPVAATRDQLARERERLPRPVVLVPTMGALHAGHVALLRRAREISAPNGSVVVSVFVNPLQFGPNEDFDSYPRAFDEDLAVCEREGAALVFAPPRSEVYRGEQQVTVDPGPVGRIFEGASRPGFFDGVLTVVLKLFQLTRPDAAMFGEKDAQQLALVRRMVHDLDLGVAIEAVPIARESDGLAASSRNRYLSPGERQTALALPHALQAGVAAGGSGAAAALAAASAELGKAAAASPPLVRDYLAVVHPESFSEIPDGRAGPALLIAAAKVGRTRLIDNMRVDLGPPSNPVAVTSSGQ